MTRTYIGETIYLDNRHFEDVVFKNCRLIFCAEGPVRLVGCTFENTRFEFGGAAEFTAEFMQAIYHGGPGGRELIEEKFEQIRQPPPGRSPE